MRISGNPRKSSLGRWCTTSRDHVVLRDVSRACKGSCDYFSWNFPANSHLLWGVPTSTINSQAGTWLRKVSYVSVPLGVSSFPKDRYRTVRVPDHFCTCCRSLHWTLSILLPKTDVQLVSSRFLGCNCMLSSVSKSSTQKEGILLRMKSPTCSSTICRGCSEVIITFQILTSWVCINEKNMELMSPRRWWEGMDVLGN